MCLKNPEDGFSCFLHVSSGLDPSINSLFQKGMKVFPPFCEDCEVVSCRNPDQQNSRSFFSTLPSLRKNHIINFSPKNPSELQKIGRCFHNNPQNCCFMETLLFLKLYSNQSGTIIVTSCYFIFSIQKNALPPILPLPMKSCFGLWRDSHLTSAKFHNIS